MNMDCYSPQTLLDLISVITIYISRRGMFKIQETHYQVESMDDGLSDELFADVEEPNTP